MLHLMCDSLVCILIGPSFYIVILYNILCSKIHFGWSRLLFFFFGSIGV
jgi:cytochrome c oxidase assembly protein Cox11